MTRPLRILVAEDEPGDLVLLKRAFALSGFKPVVNYASDGQAVTEFLESAAVTDALPTVLLLDLKMPRVDGFQVLKWLRERPAMRKILVVVFSNSEDPSDMQRVYELGADGYMVKPHEAAQFIDVLHDMQKHWLRLNATPECGNLGELSPFEECAAEP